MLAISMRRLLTALAALAVLLCVDVASACPMCKVAAESDPKLPKAFMMSILFMLSMPFTLATCFGVAFYRLTQKRDEQSAAADDSPEVPLNERPGDE